MSETRTKNSVLNVVSGLIYQIVVLVLAFVSRTLFIRYLGIEYLGVNGLFTNILSVLSLADLGIGSAIVYSMYKPIAENDTTKIAALSNYYKVLYNRIAVGVALVGICLVPFLGQLVNFDADTATKLTMNDITIYYLLFLANSVISYLFVYKTSVTTAAQKGYLLKIYNIIFSILQFVLQILAIVIFHNYILFIVIQIIMSFLQNWFSAMKSEKIYPYIVEKHELAKKDKKEIWTNVKSMFAYQIGTVVLNSTDNIIISVLLGTVWVGYYSNYSLIIAKIVSFTSIIFTSLLSSIGNLNTESDQKKKHLIFKVLNLISFWIYGFCSICLIILSQDFISMWIGKEYLLSNAILVVAVLNFYLQGILYPIWCYRNTTGLFRHTKNIMFVASALNLILSIVLGKWLGLFGVLIATAIARLATNIWFEPYKLYQIFFKESAKEYFIDQLKNVVIIFIVTAVLLFLGGMITLSNTFIALLLKGVLCAIIVNVVFFVIYRKTDEFKYIYDRFIKKLLWP